MVIRIYDGSIRCGDSSCTTNYGCPVIDYDESDNTVAIHDPEKPENGKYTMTLKEYQAIVDSFRIKSYQFPIHVTSA